MNGLENCGRYELIRRIAVGGMAEIYLARETGLAGFERLVIVKRILPNLAADTDFIDMFLDEARLAARLTHPNIVHIYELDEQDGTYFIAMEYVPGGDLHELLSRRRGALLPLDDAVHVVSEVCAGLQFAHALASPDGTLLGVVHRDVTPKNVLLSVDGVVKVMDFGIAKARAKLSVTRPGDIKGTFSYMAPEQARGERVDRRADIYAVGALLYRLTTGSPAYPQVGNALLAAVRAGQFVRPRKVNPALPPVVEEVILRAMSLEPRDRHATCGALRRELGEAARALGLHSDSESLAGAVREAFPQIPGSTVPVESPTGLPAAAPALPTREHPLAPAGPDESTGLIGMDAFAALELGGPGPAVQLEPDDSAMAMDPTEMVMAPEYDSAPTQIVADVVSPSGRHLALRDLVAPRSDPAARLPELVHEEGEEDQTTSVVELGPDDSPTKALQTPEAAMASGAVGPRASAPYVSPIPPPPPELKVVVGPRTPTATPIVRSARRPERKRKARGPVLIACCFFVGALLMAAAVTLALLPPSDSSAPSGALARPSPPEPAAPEGLAGALPPLGGPELGPGAALDAAAGPAATPGSEPDATAPEPPEPPRPPFEPDPLPPPQLGGEVPYDRPASSPVKVRPREVSVSAGPREKTRPADRPDPPRDRPAGGSSSSTGFLTVWTSPYSKVYLGSQLLGTTPMAKREVPAGKHRIRLVNPELPERVVSVTVKAGEVTRVREQF